MAAKKPVKVEMMKVEVRAATFETRDGTRAKKGDVIEVPANAKDQSQQVKWGLGSKNLKPVPVVMDLSPVTSEPVKEEEPPAAEE